MQTKLSVALAATLAGFALSAQAANVEVYGLIDTGLNYQHVDADRAGVDDVSKFQMKSSQSTPNRVGLRGTEDLGQGLKVGFVLESQFNSDDGSLMPGNRLFHRAAQIMLMSDDYGTLVLGRSGMLRSGFGTTGIWGRQGRSVQQLLGRLHGRLQVHHAGRLQAGRQHDHLSVPRHVGPAAPRPVFEPA